MSAYKLLKNRASSGVRLEGIGLGGGTSGVVNDVCVERGRFRSDCDTIESGRRGRNPVVGFSGLVGSDGSNVVDIGGFDAGIK